MGQRPARELRIFSYGSPLIVLLLALGCERDAPPAPAPATSPATRLRTVASLVPAATDMIIAMGARERLVAVSNWDAPRTEIEDLPRVGDYRTVDWEQLASLRPDVLIVQWRPDKMPPGVVERAGRLGMELVNLRIVYLDDIFTAWATLGDALGESERAAAAATDLRRQLDEVRAAVAGKPPVRTLVAQTESPLSTVGGGNFMDELLTLAGGRNVIEGGDNSYPDIDLERLVALNPDVVIHLLPGESQQVVARARTFWAARTELSAVQRGRVHLETDSYMLLPGPLVGRIARRFATILHPDVKFPASRKDRAS